PMQPARSDVVSCRAAGAPNQVDLLFMVGNGDGTLAQSDELKLRFSQFTSAMNDLAVHGRPIDLHLGVVSGDYGAGATGAPGCQLSPGGEQGKLQAIGKFASGTCQAPMGANFVHYQ